MLSLALLFFFGKNAAIEVLDGAACVLRNNTFLNNNKNTIVVSIDDDGVPDVLPDMKAFTLFLLDYIFLHNGDIYASDSDGYISFGKLRIEFGKNTNLIWGCEKKSKFFLEFKKHWDRLAVLI